MLATELVLSMKAMHTEINVLVKDGSLKLKESEEAGVLSMLARIDAELRRVYEKDHLVHFSTEEEAFPPPTSERKRSHSKAAIFKNLLTGNRDSSTSGTAAIMPSGAACKHISLEKEVSSPIMIEYIEAHEHLRTKLL